MILQRGASNKTYYLNPLGFPIGIRLPENELFGAYIQSETILLDAEDTILLYTDGITEAMNRQRMLFGEERLLEFIIASAALPIHTFGEKLKTAILSFTEGFAQSDDITFVAIRCDGAVQADRDHDRHDGLPRVESKFMSTAEAAQLMALVQNHPEYEADQMAEEIQSEDSDPIATAEKVKAELLRRRLHSVLLRQEYVHMCAMRDRRTNAPGTPQLHPDGSPRRRRTDRRAAGEADKIIPEVEADYIVGDFIQDILKSDEKVIVDTDEPGGSADSGDTADFDVPDISDSLVDQMVDDYFPHEREEIDNIGSEETDVATARHGRVSESAEAPSLPHEEWASQPEQEVEQNDDSEIIAADNPDDLAGRVSTPAGDEEDEDPPGADLDPVVSLIDTDESNKGQSFLPEVSEERIAAQVDTGAPHLSSQAIDKTAQDDDENENDLFGDDLRTDLQPQHTPDSETAPTEIAHEPETEARVEPARSQFQRMLLNGIKEYKKREYYAASESFQLLLEMDPDFDIAYQLLGNAYYRAGHLRQALLAYERFKRSMPADIPVRENLALIYAKLGVLQLAGKEWKAILELQPDRQDIAGKLLRLSQFVERTQKAAGLGRVQAAQMTKSVPDFTPKQPDTGFQGQSWIEKNSTDIKQELLLFRKELLEIGIEYYRSGDLRKSIEAFKTAIRIFPDFREVYGLLGNAYYRNKQFDDAANVYRLLEKLNNSTSHENMGFIQVRRGAYRDAIQEWEKAIAMNPARSDIQMKVDRVLKMI
jgi:tetratricopeptide (TPR) repeat protein